MSSKAMDAARRPAAKRDTRAAAVAPRRLLLPIKGVSANRSAETHLRRCEVSEGRVSAARAERGRRRRARDGWPLVA
jgi:hypothetical protein